MKPIIKDAFFDSVRHRVFNGHLNGSQVEGLELMIDFFEAQSNDDTRHLGYMMGTAYHETGGTMLPITEWGGESYFTKHYEDNKAVAKALGNIYPGDGAKYCGRGYVQLTGRRNYTKFGKLLSIDLVNHPEFALDPKIAMQIMYRGMKEGLFTGKSFSNFFNETTDDWIHARQIVNGMDRAGVIAGYGLKFFDAIVHK